MSVPVSKFSLFMNPLVFFTYRLADSQFHDVFATCPHHFRVHCLSIFLYTTISQSPARLHYDLAYFYILSHVELDVIYKAGFKLDDWIYFTLYIQLRTTGNTALSLVYILYSSSLHTH
jgi:hypothetical protein